MSTSKSRKQANTAKASKEASKKQITPEEAYDKLLIAGKSLFSLINKDLNAISVKFARKDRGNRRPEDYEELCAALGLFHHELIKRGMIKQNDKDSPNKN